MAEHKVPYVLLVISLIFSQAQFLSASLKPKQLQTPVTSFKTDAHSFPIFNGKCPPADDAANPVFLPYPSDCRKYYSCLRGLAYPFNCRDGLHFNTHTNRCEHPLVAGCGNLQSTAAGPPFSSKHPSGYEYQVDPTDCRQFYEYRLLQCPPGLLWSMQYERCDLPQFSTCSSAVSNTISPTFTPTIVATAPSIVWEPKFNYTTPTSPQMESAAGLNKLCSVSGAVFIHYPGDCHRFIQCNGIAFVKYCPSNLFWNSELRTCDRYCK